jgi:hypothetical protein
VQHSVNHAISQDGDRVGLPDEGMDLDLQIHQEGDGRGPEGTARCTGTGDSCAGPDATRSATGAKGVVMGTILLIVVVLLLVGALPTWPHSSTWGYFPSGGLGLVVLILLVLVLTGRL